MDDIMNVFKGKDKVFLPKKKTELIYMTRDSSELITFKKKRLPNSNNN